MLSMIQQLVCILEVKLQTLHYTSTIDSEPWLWSHCRKGLAPTPALEFSTL